MTDLLLLIAMAVVTFIPRFLPWALAERLNLPASVEQALTYVPIAVLTVIIVQTSLFQQQSLNLAVDNLYIWAALVAFITALGKLPLFVCIFSGLLTYGILWFYLF